MEFDGDVIISSDDQVMDYYAYDKINGNLLLESSAVTKLFLPELKEVTGNIIITYNEFLKDIGELGGLKSVGGEFKVTHNDALATSAIESLKDQITGGSGIKGAVTIEGNLCDGPVDGNGTFEGNVMISKDSDVLIYASFTRISGKLNVSGLYVTSVKLPKLQEIGGDLEIVGTSLRSLGGLSNLEQVGGEISIMDNASLRYSDMTKLKEVGQSFIVRDNPMLEQVTTFENLSKVGDDFQVCFNRDLPQSEAQALAEKVTKGGGVGGDTATNDNAPY